MLKHIFWGRPWRRARSGGCSYCALVLGKLHIIHTGWESPPSPLSISLGLCHDEHTVLIPARITTHVGPNLLLMKATIVLLMTSVWMEARLSPHNQFYSPSAIFSLHYIIKSSLLPWLSLFWIGSCVSFVYFGYNGCAPLYYYSPWVVYVLFLDSLHLMGRCRSHLPQTTDVTHRCLQFTQCLPSAPLVTHGATRAEPLRSLGLPTSTPTTPLYAGQKWPLGIWQVANTVLGWAIFGSSCMLFIAITTGQALQSLVCLSYYNQSCRVQFSEVSAWATSIYLLGGSRSIKRNHSVLLSPVSCITFGRNKSTMVSLYVIYCLKKGMWLEWKKCWLQLLPDWKGMYFLWCRTIVQAEEMVQINWLIAHKSNVCTHNPTHVTDNILVKRKHFTNPMH